MKKYILLLLLISAISLSACIDDESSDEVSDEVWEDTDREITWDDEETVDEETDDEQNWDCEIEEEYLEVRGTSMEPMISNGEEVKVKQNYYECNPEVERWDVIIYEATATDGPIIKQVRALPEDDIEFDDEWRMYINWEVMTNSEGDEYQFDENWLNWLDMYVSDWQLQSNAFFAFGDNIDSSQDSRSLWWLWLDHFEAKVVME